MQKRVNVGLKYEVYNRLKKKGQFGESFSELIGRVLDELEIIERGVMHT